MLSKQASPRIVVLKADRLYGDLICRQIKELWRNATVLVFQHGFDALDSIQAEPPDLFVAGVKIDDMDGLEHFEPFIDTTLPILVLTSRKEARTFEMLRGIRYDGIYDGHAEGLENLPAALQQVIQRRLYVSPTMVEHLKRPKNITLDALTEKEGMVLSIIGDGSVIASNWWTHRGVDGGRIGRFRGQEPKAYRRNRPIRPLTWKWRRWPQRTP